MAKNKKEQKVGTSKSALNKVKKSILKTPKNKSLDQIDTVLDRVSDNILNKDAMNQAEMMRRLFSDNLNSEVFKNISSDIIFSYDLMSRLLRYNNSEEICDMIPYCSRALKVISNEIIAPDEITKESLQFLQTDSVKEESDKALSNVRAINNVLKIEDHIHSVVSETLKLGDQFVEICDYTAKDVPITQSLLNEGVKMEDMPIINATEVELKESVVNKFGKTVEESTKFTVMPSVVESVETKENVDISNVRLIFHDPRYVIKLQSHRFKMCLGYLVLPRPSTSGNSMNSATNCGSGGRSNSMPIQNYGTMGHDFLGIDRIYKDIINLVKKHINGDEISVNKKEAIEMIGRAIKEFESEERLNFKVRYVPPERMQHFALESRRFFPYGESMFYKTTFAAKLLIAFQTALVIKRIADSSDKRAVYVETSLPRNVRNLIEDIKEGMRKRKFSIDSMGNIGSIASMVTSYETYFLPQNKGKRYVEFDQLPTPLNIRDISDELKYFRDQLVSDLDIPPTFLNLEEGLCISLKTLIKLVDGRTITLSKIIEEHNDGIKHEVYSYDHDKGVIFSNKIVWAGETKLNTKCIRVWLDNDKFIDCTPDHKFMLRDGSYIPAKYLKESDSLMPLYHKDSYWGTTKGKYRMIYHPGINLWDSEYKSFAYYHGIAIPKNGKCIHHINMKIADNRSCNLVELTPEEHMCIHGRIKLMSLEEMEDLITNRKKLDDLIKPGRRVWFENITCIICGKVFKIRSDQSDITCSDPCRNERKRLDGIKSWKLREEKFREIYPKIKVNCGWCGNEIEITKTKKYNPNKVLNCNNPKCVKMIKGYNISLGKLKGRTISRIEFVKCIICGKTMVSSPDNRFKKLKNVCNNIICINTHNSRKRNNIEDWGKKVELKCDNCGRFFNINRSDISNTKFKTCNDPECRKIIAKLNFSYSALKRDVSKIEFGECSNCGKSVCFSKYKRGYSSHTCDNLSCIYKKSGLFSKLDQSDLYDNDNIIKREQILNTYSYENQLNHKVVRIEVLEGTHDTGDIRVEQYHNFATDAGVFIHNSNKNALSFENIMFARSIVAYQSRLAKPTQGLFSKLYRMIYNKVMPMNINITFFPPRMLEIERQAEHNETVSRLINSLSELGLNREYLKKKYLSIDWEEHDRYETDSKLDSKTKGSDETEPGGGGGEFG